MDHYRNKIESIFVHENDEIVQISEQKEVAELWWDGAIDLSRKKGPESRK